MRRFSWWALLLLMAALLAPAQTSHRRLPDNINVDSDRPQPPAAKQPPVDMVQFQKDADELARLAQTVPPDIEKVKQGLISKDLNERLKKIEKLSKKLRGQLAWF